MGSRGSSPCLRSTLRKMAAQFPRMGGAQLVGGNLPAAASFRDWGCSIKGVIRVFSKKQGLGLE